MAMLSAHVTLNYVQSGIWSARVVSEDYTDKDTKYTHTRTRSQRMKCFKSDVNSSWVCIITTYVDHLYLLRACVNVCECWRDETMWVCVCFLARKQVANIGATVWNVFFLFAFFLVDKSNAIIYTRNYSRTEDRKISPLGSSELFDRFISDQGQQQQRFGKFPWFRFALPLRYHFRLLSYAIPNDRWRSHSRGSLRKRR